MADQIPTLKKLGDSATYAEIRAYLLEVESALFQLKKLPSEDPPTEIFCPTLSHPDATAKRWIFAYELHQTYEERDRFLYIGDVFRLIDEIQQKLVHDGEALGRRNPESIAADKIHKLVAAEKELFTLAGSHAVREQITWGQEERLAQYREDMREEISKRLLMFADRVAEIAKELGEDLEIKQEIQAEIVDAPDDKGEAPPEEDRRRRSVIKTEETGGSDADQPPEPTQPEPDHSVRQQFEDLRALNLETERLTNAYLLQFADHYGIPVELVDAQLREAVRNGVQTNILETLGVEGIGQLYANPILRRQILDQLLVSFNHDSRFIAALSHTVEARYQQLKSQGDTAAIQDFQNRLETAKQGDNFALFKQLLADNPEFSAKTITHTFSGDPKAELLKVCGGLPYFSDQALVGMQVGNVTEVVDALIARGVPPEMLSRLGASRFNLLFGTKLTESELNDFRGILSTYWHLRRHELLTDGVRIDWRKLGLSDSEMAEFGAGTDQEFIAKQANPTHTLVSNARQAGGSAESHIMAVGTGAGDNTKVDQRPDASYVKELKQQIYHENVWRELSDAEKVAIYQIYGYGEADLDQLMRDNTIPAKFTVADVGQAKIAMREYGLDEDYEWDADDSPFAQVSTGYNPLDSLRRTMAGKNSPAAQVINSQAATQAKKLHTKRRGGNRAAQAAHASAKRAGKRAGKTIAKKTAHQTQKKFEQQVDKTITKGLGAVANLAIPGAGLALGALPPKVQEFIGKAVRYGAMALGGLGVLGSLLMNYLWSNAIMPAFTIGGGIIGGVVGWFAGGPLGAIAGVGIGSAVGTAVGGFVHMLSTGAGSVGNWFSGLFGGETAGAAGASSAAAGSTSTALVTKSGVGGMGGPGAAITSSAAATASQAVTTTAVTTLVGVVITNTILGSALQADFPSNETNANNPLIKLSKYVTAVKEIDTGCPDDMCPEITSGTITVHYKITITPTGDNTCITVTSIKDTLSVRYSKKKYEELGKPVPTKPDRIKTLENFSPPLSTNVSDSANTICMGETLVLEYDETFDASYNHSQITNTFEMNFYWKDTTGEGTDSVMTGKRMCIGDCSMAAGCWPTTGPVTQPPFGTYSHQKMDAFDIAPSQGAPIYAPFAGKLCVANIDPGCGNHTSLQSEEGSFIFCHMSEIMFSGCIDVEAGYLMGLVGNTGNSSGPHLHYEMAMNGGFFRAAPPSLLAEIVPPSDKCIKPIDLSNFSGQTVTSCYDKEPPACPGN